MTVVTPSGKFTASPSYFADTSLDGHSPPWSTPFDQSSATRSTRAVAASSASTASATLC